MMWAKKKKKGRGGTEDGSSKVNQNTCREKSTK